MKKLLSIIFLISNVCGANNLPDLGDFSSTVISMQDENLISRQILYQVNQSGSIVRDVEIEDYLKNLGVKLINSSSVPGRNIKFFVVNDSSINAFAMLGDVIGVHSGLFLATNSESEFASVLSHEIAHITQRHIARFIVKQERVSIQNTLIMAAALLLSRSNPQLASGVMVGANAYSAQSSLNFTRENEKEADRIGIQVLDNAGFDVRASADFFKTLQKGNQFSTGASPAFLQTHPITSSRISDINDRLKDFPYIQRVDNPNFYFIKGKLRAFLGDKNTSKNILENNIRNKTYLNEAGERYGLAYAYLRNNELSNALLEINWLLKHFLNNPMIIQLHAEFLLKSGYKDKARGLFIKALQRYPTYQSFVFGLADYYIQASEAQKSINLLNAYTLRFYKNPYLYELLAKAYSMQGKKLLQYENLAESFYFKYDLQEAILQMNFAVSASDGNFYEKSRVEARLRQFQREREFYSGNQ